VTCKYPGCQNAPETAAAKPGWSPEYCAGPARNPRHRVAGTAAPGRRRAGDNPAWRGRGRAARRHGLGHRPRDAQADAGPGGPSWPASPSGDRSRGRSGVSAGDGTAEAERAEARAPRRHRRPDARRGKRGRRGSEHLAASRPRAREAQSGGPRSPPRTPPSSNGSRADEAREREELRGALESRAQMLEESCGELRARAERAGREPRRRPAPSWPGCAREPGRPGQRRSGQATE
jgi:hypothetical protein